jgi:hypothetical protein
MGFSPPELLERRDAGCTLGVGRGERGITVLLAMLALARWAGRRRAS